MHPRPKGSGLHRGDYHTPVSIRKIRRPGPLDEAYNHDRERHINSVAGMSDARTYLKRPLLAVSAAIFRNEKILVVRRARGPALHLFSVPGGLVETGETLSEAVVREVREETGLEIEPVALTGHREIIEHDDHGKVARHFIILCFAAHWVSGEPKLNGELDDARWIDPAELKHLATTEGLAEIIESAQVYIKAP
jgi:8-oxo-dGTP diphosphatase